VFEKTLSSEMIETVSHQELLHNVAKAQEAHKTIFLWLTSADGRTPGNPWCPAWYILY
jgi:hypothetical protein